MENYESWKEKFKRELQEVICNHRATKQEVLTALDSGMVFEELNDEEQKGDE